MTLTPYQIAAAEARKARLRRLGAVPTAAMAPRPVAVLARAPSVIELPAPPKPQPMPAPFKMRRLWYRAVEVVAKECDLSPGEVLKPDQSKMPAFARHVIVGILCEITTLSLPQIGHRLGGRDHTTILNSKRRSEELFASEAFRNRVDQLKAEILS